MPLNVLSRLRQSLLGSKSLPASSHLASSVERWVVVDLETSGLNPKQDDILSIAALAVQVDWTRRRMSLRYEDSFECLVRPENRTLAKSSKLDAQQKSNILLHGIGIGARETATPLRTALENFRTYANTSPLLAFHASFDQQFLRTAHVRQGLLPLTHAWLDIKGLCRVMYPRHKAHTLDEWMAVLDIQCIARHRAAADALAECEVLMRLWPQLSRQCRQWTDVQLLAGSRWGT
jgi:DNA polymerase III subunit epsilon